MTGGATNEMELILAEGAGVRGGLSTPETIKRRNRCRVAQFLVFGGRFQNLNVSFFSLFGNKIW